MEKMTLTVIEASEVLGVGRALVYSLVREGRLPAVRLGAKRLVIPRAALERFIEESALRSTGAA